MRDAIQRTGGGVFRWGGRRKGRGGKRGKAETSETGGGRWIIYALKVASTTKSKSGGEEE